MTLYENSLYQQDIKSVLKINLNYSKLKNAKILITGATGLIGTVLVDMLDFLNSTYKLNLSLDLISRNKISAQNHFEHITNTSLSIIEQNMQNPFEINKHYDFIIHGASNTHPVLYANDPVGTFTTNLFGTYYLLELAKNNPGCRFVLLSSVEIYGEDNTDNKKGFSETDFGYLDCNTVRANYCEGKRASESLCQAYKSQYGIDIVIPRLCRSYGPTLKKDDSKALSQFLRNAINGENIVLKSEGNQFYSYLYVSDIATGILFCMLNGENGEAYNIADKNSDITLKDLSQIIAQKSNTKVCFELPDSVEQKGFSKATKAILNSDKIEKLGWKAKYSIEEGIERTLMMLKTS